MGIKNIVLYILGKKVFWILCVKDEGIFRFLSKDYMFFDLFYSINLFYL